MALEFIHRGASHHGASHAARVALFPGAYNPPTVAHAEIARAALEWAEEVIWIMPRALPHKTFEGIDFAARCELLRMIAVTDNSFSVATSAGGLFAEMATEAREFFAPQTGPQTEIAVICGRDAAERAAAWDYGKTGIFEEFLEQYRLLVADRAGDYQPAAQYRNRIIRLQPAAGIADVSSTEVRRCIQQGLPWEHLVPSAITAKVRELMS